jgi:hypothetical protein
LGNELKEAAYHHCPVCGALTRTGSGECSECRLVRDTPVSQNECVREPRNPLIRFFRGLGIPLDAWIIGLLVVVWLAVFSVAENAGVAAQKVFAGLGLPCVLILSSDVLSSIRFPGYGVGFDEIDPIAIKIFAWVYIFGAHVWFIYTLVVAGN